MSEPVTFVDTNVLVYAHDASDPVKHRRATAFVGKLWADQAGVISTQVLAELYSVLTRKVGLAPTAARRVVVLYATWPILQIDMPLLAAAMLRNERDGVSWWDCVIVEAAIRAGAVRLASEDFASGQTFDGVLEVINPMAA
ncbi:MAG TPA: PIN domain-containing protein [Candidatus Limnocylindrales bacterium]|nr:PIN domain-containing protein [Candidatus Limnocylindrales bacterium]